MGVGALVSAQRGVAGTLLAAWAKVQRLFRREAIRPVHPFDLRHGTETGGLISGGQLLTGSESDRHSTAYAAVSPSRLQGALRRWMDEVGWQHVPDFTLVDLGCGKGRALLLASEYPFRRVVGVELNARLATIARSNVERWVEAGRPRCSVEVVTGDAALLQLPAGDCLLFLYNPFSPLLTRRVLAEVERQKQLLDRLYLIYQNENESTPLRDDPRLRLVWTGTIAETEEDRRADPVSSPDDVTSVYCWIGTGGAAGSAPCGIGV